MASPYEVRFGPYVWTTIPPAPDRIFYQVGGAFLEKFEVLTEIFHRILTPLYGSQEKALTQIRESKDRKCFLLYEGNIPAGVLVFKTVLSNEFAEFGIRNSIEVKSLFVDQSNKNSGRGLGSTLVDKLKDEVDLLGLDHEGIHVTVSETKQESLMFFSKKGFQIVHTWKDRYIKGVSEHLLSCPAHVEVVQNAVSGLFDTLRRVLQRDASYVSKGEPPELVHVVHNAHSDDIHALKKLSDGTIISGSKDNCLYRWSREGGLLQVIDEVVPTQRKERNWITAVEVLNDAYWLSGERNGGVFLWKTNGEFVREINITRPRADDHVSHHLNKKRVNCMAAGLDRHKPSFFVGFPTMLDEFNFIEGRTECSTKVHDNDWVYCIKPISEDRLLAVTGCTVDLWHRTQAGWEHMNNIIAEGKKVKSSQGKWQRPFISSLTSLKSAPNDFGVACFDGSVKLFDLGQQQVTRQWREHKNRVWMIENISERVFASSGEDGTIRFWDIRERKSVHVVSGHIGQVSSLLSYDENLLLAGTCSENPITSGQGAEIRYYDVRK